MPLLSYNHRIIMSALCLMVMFPLAFSQRHIHLQEIRNKKPVQYANIYAGDAVYYTDKDGTVDIPDTVSSVRISHVCYADTLIFLPKAKEHIIFMSPKVYEIPEVIVGKRTSNKQQEIGPIRKKESLFFGGRSGMSIGVYLPYQKEYDGTAIHSFVADLYDSKTLVRGSYDRIEKAVLRFDLRLPDSHTNAPSSNSLIEGGVIYEGKFNGRKVIPLEYPVSFPRSGVFVIIEWIVKGECKDNVIYNPHIRMSKSDQPSVTWQKREYRQEDWVNWDADEGIGQLQASLHAKTLNANIGLSLYENEKDIASIPVVAFDKTHGEGAKKAYLQCSYQYVHVFDSLKHEEREDLMLLFIGQKKSAFYSYYTLQADSLKREPDYQEKFRMAFLTAIQRDGVEKANFYYRRTSNYIYKDLEKNIITNYDNFNNAQFCYEDTLDAQTWEIGDSTKTILGYTCQIAETDYHGRHWVVWFTTDIPICNGPWKLGGLPGLIMEAYDSTVQHHFTMNGLRKVSDLPYYDKSKDGKSQKTTRKEFLKAKREYEENSMRTFQAQTGIDLQIDVSSTRLQRDYLETDYR